MTKEEAIKICKQVRKYFKGGKLATDDTDAIYGALTEAIEALKAEKWVPCSERLPVKIGNYLVTTSRGGVWAKRWDRGWCGNKNNNNIKAWMTLPEPYTEEK